VESIRLALLIGLACLPACSLVEHTCTEIGCVDGLSLALRTADGTWFNGSYALTFDVDGKLHTCEMILPRDRPATGSLTELSCDPALGWRKPTLEEVTTCQQQTNPGSVSQSCEPIPGHLSLHVFVPDAPQRVKVGVSRDGVTLLEQTVTPNYVESRPNGEDCEPLCRSATATVMLP